MSTPERGQAIGQISVMLVDDNPNVLSAIHEFLKRQTGLIVVGKVADGYQALAQVQRLQPQVIVVDLDMPAMSGLEVIRQLRRTQPGLIVIAFSLYDDEAYRDQALAAGAHGFVSKITLTRDLLPEIHRTLKDGGRGYN